jgi:hypothetical protein
MASEPVIHWNVSNGYPFTKCGKAITPKADFKRSTDKAEVTCLDCLTADIERELEDGDEIREISAKLAHLLSATVLK